MFFDFLYYSIRNLYRSEKDSDPEGAAFCAIGGLQAMNIVGVILLYGKITDNMIISKLFGGIIVVTLIILNYIRYIWVDKFSYENIKAAIEMKSLGYRKRNRLFQIIYLFATVLLFLGLMVYSTIENRGEFQTA